MGKLAKVFWILYFSLAPIAWLPGIAPDVLYKLKLAFIGAAIIFTWIMAYKKRVVRLPLGLLGLGGFFLLFLSSSFAFIQSDFDLVIRKTLDYSLCFIMLWSMRVYAYEKGVEYCVKIFMYSSILVSIFCIPSITNYLIGIPAWRAPAVFDYYSISTVGFEAKRTGWSNSLALYVPYLFNLMIKKSENRVLQKIFLLFSVGCIVFSQFVVAGRGGLLTSLIMILLISYLFLPKRWLYTIVLCTSVIIVLNGSDLSESNKKHLRADRLEQSGDAFTVIDHFSAGRIGGFVFALNKFSEQPFTGYGFGSIDSKYDNMAVHNLWLKMLVEGGIFMPLALLIIIYKVFQIGLKGGVSVKKPVASTVYQKQLLEMRLIMIIVLIGGVIISIFEPNALIGSFQKSAMWWASVGVLCQFKRKSLLINV